MPTNANRHSGDILDEISERLNFIIYAVIASSISVEKSWEMREKDLAGLSYALRDIESLVNSLNTEKHLA